jgi:hypothetical protein
MKDTYDKLPKPTQRLLSNKAGDGTRRDRYPVY